jgi:prepilin-type N-terminal cleavage/methylation domain-containing protein
MAMSRLDGATSGISASDPRGFTLIEIGVAVSLFAIVLIAAGGLLSALSSGSRHSNVKTTGTFHMQRQVERLYELDYANLANGQADTTLANGQVIRAAWTVTELVPMRLSQIDMTVGSVSAMPGGQERAVRVFIANRNP